MACAVDRNQWPRVIANALLFCVLASCATTVPLNVDTFSPSGVLSGSIMTRNRCNAEDTSVWAVVDGQGECIRYFHAGLKPQNQIVHIWFHGDRLKHNWSGRGPASGITSSEVISYGHPSPEGLQKLANRNYSQYGIPYIRFSRPGAYGSSGDHNQRRRLREALVVNAAVDALKSKYGVKTFVLSGQSGGGHIVASMLNLRQDITCAVSTSGAVAVQQRSLIKGWGGVDATGYSDYFDPIETVGKITPDPGRRIFIIGDPRDTNVPFETQVAFFNKLKEKGHQAWLIETQGSGPEYHNTERAGFHVAKLCADGVPGDEIVKSVGQLSSE